MIVSKRLMAAARSTASEIGTSMFRLPPRRAAAAAKWGAVNAGRVVAYPFSLAYRLVANATASVVPLGLIVLIAWGALELYDRAVEWIDSETFNLFTAIGLVGWTLNTVLAGVLPATRTFFATLRKVFFTKLQPWAPGLVLHEELRASRNRLRNTAREGFRELLKPTGAFLGILVLAVLLWAAVKAVTPTDPTNRTVWVAAPDACCAKDCEPGDTRCPGDDECFTPIECALATRGLAADMEFILTYPSVLREPPTGLSANLEWDDGLGLREHHRNVLQLVKEASSMCSGPDHRVSLIVQGFASDQPPQGVAKDQYDEVNLDFAHERAVVAVSYLCGLDPTAVTSNSPCTGPAPDANDATRFNVHLTEWETPAEMKRNRPHHDDSGDRMQFLHRSVRVTVDDPGRCPLDESPDSS